MPSRFVDLKLVSGDRLILNTNYIMLITPTHGDDFNDGADVSFISFGEAGVHQVSVPASQVDTLMKSVSDPNSTFLDLKPLGGSRLVINYEHVTHITPTHGVNLADGADVAIWGMQVQIPASGISALSKVL